MSTVPASYHLQEVTKLEAEIERLRQQYAISEGINQAKDGVIERLRDLVIAAQPEMERIEFCEASAEDGMTSRLTTLRQWLANARHAAIAKEGK
jgi:transposase